MRYFIFTILLVVPLLLTAQSKKEQIATLNLRVDSLSEVLVNVRLNNAQTLSDKSDKIFQLSQEKSDLEKSIVQMSQEKSDFETEVVRLVQDKSKIEEENGRLTLEVDSLAKLILAPEQIKPYYKYGMMGTYFDFNFDDFNHGNGNPVNIIPVGWSKDGMFCYITDYYSLGDGSCSMTITIQDIESNTIAKRQAFDLGEAQYEEEAASQIRLSATSQLNDLCKEYSIIPTGIGVFHLPYETNKYYTNINNLEGDYFQIEVEMDKSSWRILASGEKRSTVVLLSGDFEFHDYYEVEEPLAIKVAGVIGNPIGDGNHLAAVVFTMKLGFEAMGEWDMTLIPLPE